MKDSKIAALELIGDIGIFMNKETMSDTIRTMSDMNECYENKIFEIGVQEVVKQYRKIIKSQEGNY